MAKLVTIFGGSGFVGRYIARRLAKEGWRVRVAVRRPNEAIFVKPYGAVGQVEPIFCNIRDDDSVRAVLQGADAAVNCVGILAPNGKNTFEAVQAEEAERVAKLCAELNVASLVHVSSIGADAESESDYQQTKAAGEAGVLAHFPNAMILRPSIVFGAEDDFFNRFASMSRFGPVLPIVGADSKFQPVYVDDVAQAAVLGVSAGISGTFELGGPEVSTMRELMSDILGVIRRRRLVLNIPFFAANLMAMGFGVLSICTGGLVKAPLTRDQVRTLRNDNVVSDSAKGLSDLDIKPTSLGAVLPSYLWRFRPSGQYDAIKESAKGLRIE